MSRPARANTHFNTHTHNNTHTYTHLLHLVHGLLERKLLGGRAADGLEAVEVFLQVELEHLAQGGGGVGRDVLAAELAHGCPVPVAQARVAEGGNQALVLLELPDLVLGGLDDGGRGRGLAELLAELVDGAPVLVHLRLDRFGVEGRKVAVRVPLLGPLPLHYRAEQLLVGANDLGDLPAR